MFHVNKYIFMIVLQNILYGVMDIVSKCVYRTMNVYCFLFCRYLFAAVLILLLWKKQILPEIRTVSLKKYIVQALCMSMAFIFSNLALKYTAATNMSFIRSLSALIAPLLALIVLKEKIKISEWLVMIFMLPGLYLLCAKGGLHGFGFGEVPALTAATLVAGSLVFGKTALDYVDAKTLSFMQTFLAIFFCGAMTFLSGSFSEIKYVFRVDMILSLLYAAIGCTITGYMLQNVALKHISSRQVAIIQCLYPIATAVIAFILLGERLSIAGMAGAAIIIACVCMENFIKN